MSYDLFISYSRKDNFNGQITALKLQIEKDYKAIKPYRNLVCFFDTADIHGMEDWRHRILEGLRESSLFLLFLSPGYLTSPYCEWEITEYLKYEHSRATAGQGVAPVYFVEVPGLDSPAFEERATAWVSRVRRRNHFDLRPWHDEGASALSRLDVRSRLKELEQALHGRISRLHSIANAPGNLPMPNPYFVGREIDIQRVHESAGLGPFGTVTVIHGLGGLGKTSLSIQYAYAYADFYPGGRWLLKCQGEKKLATAICQLVGDLEIAFHKEETWDVEILARRILKELERNALERAKALSSEGEPVLPRTLLILDNVDHPCLIQPPETDLISGKSWLHVLVTTRIGGDVLTDDYKRQILLSLDELLLEDSVCLIERHQVNEMFPDASERNAAEEISRMLDGFTLAVERIAVYLGEKKGRISCAAMLERLRNEGFAFNEVLSGESKRDSDHRKRCLESTLGPTLDLLHPSEYLFLSFASFLPPDSIPLPWLRSLCATEYPGLAEEALPGYEDPWMTLVNHLLGLRLIQGTPVRDENRYPIVVRMHRLIGQMIVHRIEQDGFQRIAIQTKLNALLFQRVGEFAKGPVLLSHLWEIDSLYKTIEYAWDSCLPLIRRAAVSACSILYAYGRFHDSLTLSKRIISSISGEERDDGIPDVWCHNLAGMSALSLGDSTCAESHFLSARTLLESRGAEVLDRLDTLSNIGSLFRETYRPQLALEPSREALAMAEELFHPEAPEVGLHCINLGLVLQDLGRLPDAITLFYRAVEMDLKQPEFSLNLSRDMATLAEALRNAGQYKEAERRSKEALQLALDHGFERHPAAALLMNNHAKTLEALKYYEDARKELESARELTEELFGQESVHLSLCLNNLGINSLCNGNIQRSVHELQDSLDIERAQRTQSYHRLAHRELNLAAACLLNQEPETCIGYVTAGWQHLLSFPYPSLMTVRLLLVRLLAAWSHGESANLFMGQLVTLLKGERLIAPCMDVIWSLEEVLDAYAKLLPEENTRIWQKLYHSLTEKMESPGNHGIVLQEGLTECDLTIPWPS